MTTTNQQRFLEHLKDPIKAKLDDAIEEFQHANPSIHDVRYEIDKHDIYIIEVFADNSNILHTTSKIFENIVTEHLGEDTVLLLYISQIDEIKKGLFRHCYLGKFTLHLNNADKRLARVRLISHLLRGCVHHKIHAGSSVAARISH